MLFDRTGQAIYLFDKETTRRLECYGTRTLCHNVTEFGGRWPVVARDGFAAYPGKDNQDEKIRQKIDP